MGVGLKPSSPSLYDEDTPMHSTDTKIIMSPLPPQSSTAKSEQVESPQPHHAQDYQDLVNPGMARLSMRPARDIRSSLEREFRAGSGATVLYD
jgi:hypothetical protein